ncbi:MAG: DUF2164 domain-containing protein [Dehalococcoidia bacterium]
MSDEYHPTHIELTDERRERVLAATSKFFAETFDDELSEFRRDLLLEFFIKELGAPVYNQAIQDVRKALQEKLDDLDGEFFEPEPDASELV